MSLELCMPACSKIFVAVFHLTHLLQDFSSIHFFVSLSLAVSIGVLGALPKVIRLSPRPLLPELVSMPLLRIGMLKFNEFFRK